MSQIRFNKDLMDNVPNYIEQGYCDQKSHYKRDRTDLISKKIRSSSNEYTGAAEPQWLILMRITHSKKFSKQKASSYKVFEALVVLFHFLHTEPEMDYIACFFGT